jgi:hypothetical protein
MAYVRSAIIMFQHRNDIYRGASVTAYEPDADGDPTATKITLYANPTGGTTLANPQILDGEGRFRQPVYAEVPCVLVVSSAFASADISGVISPPLSSTDVADAAADAAAAAASAAAAAQSAIDASNAADTATAYWPTYYRHENLFTTAQ